MRWKFLIKKPTEAKEKKIAGIIDVCAMQPGFYKDSGDLNSGPCGLCSMYFYPQCNFSFSNISIFCFPIH